LWNILKSKKLEGRKFRRQHSIGSFIVDFCCPSEKLIVELDGAPHGEYVQIEKDIKRNQPPRPVLAFVTYRKSVLRPPLLQKEGKLKLPNLSRYRGYIEGSGV